MVRQTYLGMRLVSVINPANMFYFPAWAPEALLSNVSDSVVGPAVMIQQGAVLTWSPSTCRKLTTLHPPPPPIPDHTHYTYINVNN